MNSLSIAKKYFSKIVVAALVLLTRSNYSYDEMEPNTSRSWITTSCIIGTFSLGISMAYWYGKRMGREENGARCRQLEAQASESRELVGQLQNQVMQLGHELANTRQALSHANQNWQAERDRRFQLEAQYGPADTDAPVLPKGSWLKSWFPPKPPAY